MFSSSSSSADVICESDTADLTCPAGLLITGILTANYGRTDMTTCATATFPIGHGALDNDACINDVSVTSLIDVTNFISPR